MVHLIDKDALVAKINQKINSVNKDTIEDWRYRLQWEHDIEVMKNIISLIDTLEVKEVDLEKEMDTYFETMEVLEHENIFEDTFQRIAKHFFELGLKARQG